YPDLAFSLPPDALPHSNGRAPSRPVIGVGVMRYDNERNFPINGETAYHGYLDKLVTFLLWLLEHDYTVRLFIRDALYDDGVIEDVKRLLVERGAGKRTDQILHEPMACVEDLLTQLTTTDLVFASRFHNLVLAVMLNKVVGSISYHEKIE